MDNLAMSCYEDTKKKNSNIIIMDKINEEQ